VDFDSLVDDSQKAKESPPGSGGPLRFDDLQDDEERYGGTIGALKAAGLGAARSLSFGTSDQLFSRTGLVTPEELKGYEETNPTASTVGEVGGILGAVIAPEAGILGALSAPVKAVSKLGSAITAGAAAPAITTAGKVLSQAGALAAGSAVEGAAYGLGQAVSEDALGDPSALGEKLFSHVGQGALLGAGLGGVLGAGKVAIPAAIEKAGLKTEALREVVGDTLAKAAAKVSGKSEEDIKELTRGLFTKEGAEVRQKALEGFKERESTVRDLTKGLSDQADSINKATKQYYQGARQEEISKLMSEVPHETAFNAAADTAGDIKAAIKEMRSEPELYSATGKVRQAELISEGLENKLVNAKTSEDVYHAVNDAKQQLGTLSKFQGMPTDAERATIARIKQIGHEVKTHLENPAIYGEAGARQAALNSAYSEYASASKDFLKSFGKRLSNGETQIDPGKVNSFLNQVGRPAGDIRQQILADYIEASQGLAKQMAETSKNAVDNVDTNKLMDLFRKTQDIAEGAESELEAVNKFKRLKESRDSINVGGVTGASVATYLMGPAGGAAYSVFHGLRNPAEMVRILSEVERFALKTTNAINKGASGIFKLPEGLGSTARAYGSVQYATSDEKRSTHDKIGPTVSELSSDPEKLIEKLHENTEALNEAAPKTSQAVQGSMIRAVQFLQQKLPGNNITRKPLSPEYKPSDAELAKWYKYFSAVERPTQVLQQIAIGNLVPETMETLAVVYPKLLSEMQVAVTDKLTDAIAKKKLIPYRTKLSLSMFLGSDLVNSLDPKTMLAMQNTMATATQAKEEMERGQMNNASRKSLGTIKSTSRYMTPMQKSAAREDA
jgi:hypothetical protein